MNTVTQSRRAPAKKVESPAAPPARLWSADIQAILPIKDQGQMLQAVSALLVGVTGAQASFLYTRQNGDLDCLASKIVSGIPASLMEGQQARQTILETLAGGAPRQTLLMDEKGRTLLLATLPAGPLEDRKLALAVILENITQPAGTLAGLMHVAALAISQWQAAARMGEYENGFRQATLFLELLNRSAQSPDHRRAMATLADEMRAYIGCDQVAIGLGSAGRCRVNALSAAGQFDPKGHTSTLLAAFMREAIAVGSPIGWPGDLLPADSHLAPAGDHRKLAEALGADFLTALPLRAENGDVCGAWVCAWKTNLPTAKWRLVRTLTPHLAATAHLIDLARPRGIRGWVHKILSPEAKRRRHLVLGVTAALGLGMLIPIPYKLGASCWVEPERRREVAAPFDGIIQKPEVRPGDFVKQGQLLATLDGREIRWKLAEAKSRLEVAFKQRNQAMSINDMPAAHLSDLEAQAETVNIRLLEDQQSNLEVRAPLDGLILRGDLEQSEGVPVTRGQKLFEIAEIDRLSVRIAVPDAEAAQVKAGMPVHLRLESQVGYKLEAEIKSIRPASEVRDGENIFVALAEVDNRDGLLRPGMRGKARIQADSRPIGWVVFHRFYDFLRLNLPW